MLQRTLNCKNEEYKNYGARGISVCKEWHDFSSFSQWANENGYKPGLSIDRKDYNEGYCPSNCRWVTMKTQQRNRRNNRLVSYKGKTKCLSEWAEVLGLTHKELSYRLDKGWPIKRAFTEPIKKRGEVLCG